MFLLRPGLCEIVSRKTGGIASSSDRVDRKTNLANQESPQESHGCCHFSECGSWWYAFFGLWIFESQKKRKVDKYKRAISSTKGWAHFLHIWCSWRHGFLVVKRDPFWFCCKESFDTVLKKSLATVGKIIGFWCVLILRRFLQGDTAANCVAEGSHR